MKTYELVVKGKSHTWGFMIHDPDPKHVADWRADGLDVDEVMGEIDAEADALAAEVLEMLSG